VTEPFVIRGRRVNLRTVIRADIDDYDRWSDPNLKAWQYDGPWYGAGGTSSDGVKRLLAEGHRPPFSRMEIETADGVHIGWVVAYQRQNDPHTPEFGIDIVEEAYWNKGLGTECLYLWIDYLFRERKFTRLGFSTWSGNPRMIAVGKKLGFKPEACIRNGCEVNGKFYDRIKMGILKEEWKTIRDRLEFE